MAFTGSYADAGAAIADGLIHYWPMDETAGASVSDVVGDFDGVSVTGVYPQTNSIQPGLFGNGRYCFEHISELGSKGIKITPASGEGTGELSAFTVAIWVNPEWVDGFYSYAGFGYPFSVGQVAFGCDNPGKLWLQYGATGELYFESTGGVISTGSWSLLALTYDGSTIRLYHNNVEIYSASTAATRLRHRYGWSALGALPDPNIYGVGYDALATIDESGIWNRALSTGEIATLWNDGDGVPLLGETGPAEFHVAATLDAPAVSMKWWEDWTAMLDPSTTQIYYRAVLTGAPDGVHDMSLSIKSWQATVQDGRADYVQAVVPGVGDEMLADVIARQNGQIVIYRGARTSNGEMRELELARVGPVQYSYNRGPRRATLTLSGYGVAGNSENDSRERVLSGVRSVSVSPGGMRVRASIDWLLRPRMWVNAGGREFRAAWINYYVTETGEYMDVGDRSN